MRTTNVRQHLKGTYTDMADPQVAKAASGLTIGKQSTSLRHRSSTSHKDGLRLQRQGNKAPHQGQTPSSWASHMAGLYNSTRDDPVYHRRGLLKRRAKHASLEPPFNLRQVYSKDK